MARREMRLAYGMLLPTFVIVFGIVLVPLLANFWISFKPAQLGDLRPPTLIVNATSYTSGKRRAFWAERDPNLPMARLVAGSGAFPIVFDPVRIEGDAFMDGGVVDNLGVAGLQHYFDAERRPGIDASDIPGILIISDASNLPDAPSSWRKHSLGQMAVRAQQVSYNAIHSWIYAILTDGEYERGVDRPESVRPADLAEHVRYLHRERELQPTSITRHLATIRVFFRFLLANGVIDDDPTAITEPIEPRQGTQM